MMPDTTVVAISSPCSHLNQVKVRSVARPAPGCTECLAMGARWVHLRVCLACGQVGCCDSSPNRHATAHFHATGHPIVTSGEAGETWVYCYPDDAFLSE